MSNEPVRLKPGQKKRGHRILLLFWQGERLHGQNMFRRMLREHTIPPLRGESPFPLVSVNSCFTHNGKGRFLGEAKEENLAPLVEPFARRSCSLSMPVGTPTTAGPKA